MTKRISGLLLVSLISITALAAKPPKATEIGIGGSVMQFNRVTLSDFKALDDAYSFNMKIRHVTYGGNLYLAFELNRHFYLDLQGIAGFAEDYSEKRKWFYGGGLGLQYRIGTRFNSRFVEPYLRIGAGYMYKDFAIDYSGEQAIGNDEAVWKMKNINNKYGLDRKHLIPVSPGIGINMWFSDHFGIGLQGDYVIMPYKDVANSLQGTARLIWRIGGVSKKRTSETVYVPEYVNKYVEVEKIVRDTVVVDGGPANIYAMIHNINFDFDKYELKPQYKKTIADIAKVLMHDTSKRYLITGYTDSRGSDSYNVTLSGNRAEAIVRALIDQGVPANMLKHRGVGKKIAFASPAAPESTREGDRKATIELIDNTEYWNLLP